MNVKIVLVGDTGVGKTSFFQSYQNGRFPSEHIPTIGVDFSTQTLTLPKGTVKLHIWDSAGQERFRAITDSYYRGADVICLVYDVSNRTSFDNLKQWVQTIQAKTEPLQWIVIANKTDLPQWNVPSEEGILFAQSLNAGFFEVSAKTCNHVQDVFAFLADQVLEKRSNKPPSDPISILPTKLKRFWCF